MLALFRCPAALLITLALCNLSFSQVANVPEFRLGIFYFPGWSLNLPFTKYPDPWDPIRQFAYLEPLLGWYDDNDPRITDIQMRWIKDSGINFVIFDWYFGPNRLERLDKPLKNFLVSPVSAGLSYSLMWANHDEFMTSVQDWDAMVDIWLFMFGRNQNFFAYNKKPVVFVYSADLLKINVERIGSSTQDIFARAQDKARAAGFPGIAFVAGTDPNMPMISSWARESGYSLISAYNLGRPLLHSGPLGFAGLDLHYRQKWAQYKENSSLPVLVPMTSGWDRRPWGGSSDSAFDGAIPNEFMLEEHLKEGIARADEGPLPSHIGVLCCWNEFGEGSIIEPTKLLGLQRLVTIQRVLRARANGLFK